MRLLEGEPYLYNGVVYIAKGYQHPHNYIVAYPRYSALTSSKLSEHERTRYVQGLYWDCIKQHISAIPKSKASIFEGTPVTGVLSLKGVLESLLEVEVHLTGSSLISDHFNDIDFTIYGATGDLVSRLEEIYQKGVLERSTSLLVREYSVKHRNEVPLQDYLHFKRKTLLHGLYKGIHLNFKLIEYSQGFTGCVDPVYEMSTYTGRIEVLEALNPHLIPARYRVAYEGGEAVLETLRELYCELEPGLYYASMCRLETRKDGFYIMPDLCILRPLR